MEITEIRDKFFTELEDQSDEFKAGAMAALKMVIDIGWQGFGGDACDFAEWLNDKAKIKE